MTEEIQKKAGRPPEFTEAVRLEMEKIAGLDGSIEEMAYQTGFAVSTIYRWLQEKPELKERIDGLRQRMILKARISVDAGLSDPDRALRYLERKRPKEFMPSSKIEHSGTVQMEHSTIDPEFKRAADEAKLEYEAKIRKLYEGPEIPDEPDNESNEQSHENDQTGKIEISQGENRGNRESGGSSEGNG